MPIEHHHTTVVSPWGFRLECDFQFDPGEPMILSPIDSAHPGSPPNADLFACRVGGIDITDMVSPEQRGLIESRLVAQMEGQ